MTLDFFRTARDARAARKPLAWLSGAELRRNVIVGWEQGSVPRRPLRKSVLDCLRTEAEAGAAPGEQRSTPRAGLATFGGYWGGHDRGLRITSHGRGAERANSSCCTRVYDLSFQILSVSGTLTRATASYRVMSFKRYDREAPTLRRGQMGKLVLRNGILTNALTQDFFCSNPAWGATGACGA